MEVKQRSGIWHAFLFLALCVLLAPALSFANVYDSNIYGEGLYGSGVDPTGTVTASPPIVTVAGNVLSVSSTFNEPMGRSTLPTITFSPDVSPSFTASSTAWTSTTTVTATYTVATGVVQTGIVARVSGAQDTYGTVAAAASSTAFAIDTTAPSGSVISSPVVVTVSNTTLTVTTNFTKTMNTAVTPTISFSPDISGKLTSSSSGWTNASSTYSVSYTAADGILNTGIVVIVSGAVDADGNAAASATSNPFAVETESGNGPPSLIGGSSGGGGGGGGGGASSVSVATVSSGGSAQATTTGQTTVAAATTSTSTTSATSIVSLVAQIKSLIAVIKSLGGAISPKLEAMLAAFDESGSVIDAGSNTLSTFAFGRGLQLGMTGEDVRQLQIYLNTHAFLVAPSGNGSPGKETDYFGPATQAALAKFQRANGITTDTGYFGPRTKALITR